MSKSSFRAACFGVAAFLLSCVGAHAQGLAGFGVVVMHGKQAEPSSVGQLTGALRAEGAVVITPQMPWSSSRMYDATWESAMAQIDSAVAQLKSQGATRIVIAGHSFGGNAAMGYAGSRSGIAAVIAISPGHAPETSLRITGPGLEKAKQMADAGQGDTKAKFPDFNQGRSFEVTTTPKIYASLFRPTGPANLHNNAAGMKPVPILFLAASGDSLGAESRPVYQSAAKNGQSKFVEVSGGHQDTIPAAASAASAWLKGLK